MAAIWLVRPLKPSDSGCWSWGLDRSCAKAGCRLSVIATAPQRRLAIKTFVRSETSGVIREAVLRELKRGGQVYFLHNEVDTIENRRDKLVELLPETPPLPVEFGVLTPHRELQDPKVRLFIEFAARELKGSLG